MFIYVHIAGIHVTYISSSSDKLCGRQKPFVNRVCIKFEYITKVYEIICNTITGFAIDSNITSGAITIVGTKIICTCRSMLAGIRQALIDIW